MNLNNPSQDELNYLRRLMASGQISPENMSQMSGSFGAEQMPQQMPEQFEQPRPQNALAQMAIAGNGFQDLQRGQGVVQQGNNAPIYINSQTPQNQGPQKDMTRPIEIAGQGKGYYSADGKSAIFDNQDGSQRSLMLGYNRGATQANQDRQMKIAKFESDQQESRGKVALDAERLRQAGLSAGPEKPTYDSTRGGFASFQNGKALFTPLPNDPNKSDTTADMGLPRPSVTPWSNQSNERDANRVKSSELMRGSKEIEKDADAAKSEASVAQEARRFMALNATNETGGIADQFAIGRGVQGLSGNYKDMTAITAKLAPAARPPGSGATSDFDAKQFERATMGVDKLKATNDNIGNGIIARSQSAQDYAEFRASMLEQNGTLAGSTQAWNKYLNANPIFDKTKEDEFALNKNRVSYRDFFKGQGTAVEAPRNPNELNLQSGAKAGKAAGKSSMTYDDPAKEQAYQQWLKSQG